MPRPLYFRPSGFRNIRLRDAPVSSLYPASTIKDLIAAVKDDAVALGAPERQSLTYKDLRQLVQRTVESLNAMGCNAAPKLALNNPALLDGHGFAYFRMGKFDLAKAGYDIAIAAAPRAFTFYKRGIVKNRQGDVAGGNADIAAAMAIDPHAGDAMA